MEAFDVVVIGGGPGGYIAAIRASQLGLKSACIEMRGTLGGTCLNVGCIPSKALLESSEFYEKIAHRSQDYGIKVENAKPDIPAMIKRKSGIVSKFTKGIEGLFKKNKVTYYKGRGSFVDAHTILVQGEQEAQISAKNIIIATGSSPIELSIAKFDQNVVVSSTEALDFEKAPEHLVVIGGGVIGLELGSVWTRLGSKVTVLEAMPTLLGNMDGAVSKAMMKILTAQGLDIKVGTKVTAVDVQSKDRARVTAAQADGTTLTLDADKVLVCVGRRAFTDGLKLDAVGIATQPNGKIKVDHDGRVAGHTHVYAVGDVIDGMMLAHKAEEEGVAVAERIAGKHGHVNYEAIPNVIYTWPEVASVGMTEEQCKSQGIEVNIGQFPFAANGRAACAGYTEGFVKLIADKKTDRLLGAHIVGPTASELIAELAIAFEFGSSAEDIARSVHAHPTLAEVIKEAALAVDKRSLSI